MSNFVKLEDTKKMKPVPVKEGKRIIREVKRNGVTIRWIEDPDYKPFLIAVGGFGID